MNRYSNYFYESKDKDADGERQLKDPKTEIMVVKDGKVIVIDKKDEKKYMKMGYGLAESKDMEDENDEDEMDDEEEDDDEQMEESKKLDKVDDDELDGSHDEREDGDIDNDGDEDSSDEYLHKRRKAIGKAIDKVSESYLMDLDR